MRTALLLSAILMIAPARARAGAGTSAADFLNIGVGPRAVAMGGSFTALADDVSALYWNPAGLAQLQQQEISLAHTKWVYDFNYEYMSYARPHERLGTWAASYALLQKSGIPSYDEAGGALGTVKVSDSVGTLGWGRSFSDKLALGVSGKWIKESLAGYSANSYAADLGALGTLYEDPFRRVTAGFSVKNLGKHGAFISASEPLPRSVAVGLGFHGLAERLNANIDGVVPSGQSGYVALGGEYWIHPMLAARFGYQTSADVGSGMSAGVGFRLQALQFDYAFGDQGALGFAHRIGVSYRFGNAGRRLYDEGVRLMRQGDYAEAFLKFNKALTINRDDRSTMLRMKECRQHIQQELKQVEPLAPDPAAPLKDKAP